MASRYEDELERSLRDLERSAKGSGTSLGSRTLGGSILDELRANDRRQAARDLARGKGQGVGRLGKESGPPNVTTGAHGLYVASIFLQDLATRMSEEWMYELLANLGRDATQRAQNKLGMFQPPENILGYEFPAWQGFTEKYRAWKMATRGMESPGILRGEMQASIDWYVVPQVYEVVVGSYHDYAYWFEMGTNSGMPPRPFLAPSVLEATRDWIYAAQRAGFMEEGGEYAGMSEIPNREAERFSQGTMAEAVNKLREAMCGEDLPGARKKAFIPAIVERVFPGVEDWRWPSGAEGMQPDYTGYMIGSIPRRVGWSNYEEYMRQVREAGHRSPLESMEEIPREQMLREREGPEDPDIDF